MLTPTDIKNINNFENLKKNTQRVFKHRLKQKCTSALKDIEIILKNYEKLNIQINEFLDINQIANLLEWYKDLCLLQNM